MDFGDTEGLPSRELGENIVESQIEELGGMAHRLLGTYEKVPERKEPSQRYVDDIWYCFDKTNRQYWTSKYSEYRNGVAREFPGWEALGE